MDLLTFWAMVDIYILSLIFLYTYTAAYKFKKGEKVN